MNSTKGDSYRHADLAAVVVQPRTVASTAGAVQLALRSGGASRPRLLPKPVGIPVAEDSQDAQDAVLAFGPFRLLPQQRMLLRDGVRVKIPGRAWDILLALVGRPGDVVRKGALLQRLWPDGNAKEATLRVHVAILRKVLENGHDRRCYIENVTGLGYRFIMPVRHLTQSPVITSAAGTAAAVLPPQQLIGREEVLARLIACVPARRFMTIVGAGGVGKTTLAEAALHGLHPAHFTSVCFINLASIVHPEGVAPRIAGALGLTAVCGDPLTDIGAQIRDQRLLIVLDNCEQIIESAAHIVERLLGLAPQLHILATSREPLRARGEYVLRLVPLELPPSATLLTAAEALAYPAVRLFIQRAARTLDDFEVHDADIPAVVEICRRLDGLPLAIELAAARTEALGVHELALNLCDHLTLLTRGPRTAPPRQQTLRATLDWSYERLTPAEQVALRRLAVFDCFFDEPAARGVLADPAIDKHDVLDLLTSLVAKSLLNSHLIGTGARFRLLQTTRAYALEKLQASGESAAIESRRAQLV